MKSGKMAARTCLTAGLLAGCAFLAAFADDPFAVPARHRPKAVMGRDYWTMLFSFYYTDPGYLAQMKGEPKWMDNPELGKLPVFRDCALCMRGDVGAPDPDTGKATYRTMREYFATNGRWEQLQRNPKPDKPMIVQIPGMRGACQQALIGEIDREQTDYEAWKRKSPNFLAFWTAAEWENDLQYARWLCTIWTNNWRYSVAKREELKAFLEPWPTNRYQRATLQKKSLARRFDLHWGDREHSSAMRACMAIDHMAAAWGIRVLMLETTNSTRPPQEYRWNIQPMFTRGAARQFGIPWEWYVATYVNGYCRDGSWLDNGTCGYSWGWPTEADVHPERGISVSLNRRVFYFAYLSGANFIEQEGWYGSFLMKDPKTGKAALSPRGRDFSDFHDFAAAHPDRGAPYTPVAVLVPYEQGYPAFGGKSWVHFAYTPGDQTVDAVFFTLDPGYDRETFTKKGGEANMHNSKYALMYDVVCPDAPQKPEDLLATLKSYRALVVTGDYRDTGWEKTLAVYERDGGRVIRIDPQSLPPIGKDDRKTVAEIQTGRRAFPSVAKILDGLQADYFPFRVAGDVMYGANKVEKAGGGGESGWWLWVFNNKGVTKFADQFQEIDPTKASAVTVSPNSSLLASHSRVRELLSGRAVEVRGGSFSWTVPAGDLAIFEIK